MKYSKLSTIAASAILGMALLTGCGSDSSSSTTATSPVTTVEQTPSDGYFSKVNDVNMSNKSYKFNIKFDENNATTVKAGSSYIDTNNNQEFDENDTKLLFDIKSHRSAKVANPLTTIVMDKNSSSPDFNVSGVDLSTFDPIAELENVDSNTSSEKLNLIKLNKVIAKVAQKSLGVSKAFNDVNLTKASQDSNITASIDAKNNVNIGNEITLIEKIVDVIKTTNEVKKAGGDVNSTQIVNLIASIDSSSDEINKKLQIVANKNAEQMKKSDIAKKVVENALKIAKEKKGDSKNLIPDLIKNIVKTTTGTVIDDLNSTSDVNTSVDINTTDINTTIDTDLNATLNDINSTLGSIDKEIEQRPVAILIDDYAKFGEKRVNIIDNKSFKETVEVNNTSKVEDFYHIVLPIDKVSIDKNASVNLNVAVKITRKDTNQEVSMMITGGKLETTVGSENTANLSFDSSSMVKVNSKNLDGMLENAETNIEANSTISTTDFDINVATILNSLQSSSQLDSQIAKLNEFLLRDGISYDVMVGLDANITTEFDTINIDNVDYQGIKGEITIKNAQYNSSSENNNSSENNASGEPGSGDNSGIDDGSSDNNSSENNASGEPGSGDNSGIDDGSSDNNSSDANASGEQDSGDPGAID